MLPVLIRIEALHYDLYCRNFCEGVLLCVYNDFLISDKLQFGFKKNSSCVLAFFTVNKSIKYFTKRGSKAFWLPGCQYNI